MKAEKIVIEGSGSGGGNSTRVAPRTGNRVTRAGRAVSRAVGNAVRRVTRRSVSRRRG